MLNILVKSFVRGVYKSAGLDSPYAQKSYGANWTKQQNKCLERDSHQCRICGKTRDEIGREPAVHHITPRNQFDDSEWRVYNDLSNLITLCHSCHGKYEGEFTDASPEEFVARAKQ